jgi:hypothetical protein
MATNGFTYVRSEHTGEDALGGTPLLLCSGVGRGGDLQLRAQQNGVDEQPVSFRCLVQASQIHKVRELDVNTTASSFVIIYHFFNLFLLLVDSSEWMLSAFPLTDSRLRVDGVHLVELAAHLAFISHGSFLNNCYQA